MSQKSSIFVKNIIMNEYPKVLILGDGLLGSEIIKQTGWQYLSHDSHGIDVIKDFDGLLPMIDDIDPDVVVNCIGYTNTYDKDRYLHWELNYKFVANLVDFCDSRNIKLVHVSSDYIYANWREGPVKETDVPVNQNTWYAYTKLLSDAYVQLRIDNYLMVRCSFKPTPFPYDNAFTNIWGSFDYVDVIAGQLIELINEDRNGIWNIGTKYKSVYNLARQTKPDVGMSKSVKLPNIKLDLTKFNTRNKQ
jgi:dTDP-4-dehydrorhamnose reductase